MYIWTLQTTCHLHSSNRWLESCQGASCPSCSDPVHIFPPSDMLMRVLGRVVVICQSCNREVRVSDMKTHAATKCGEGGTIQDLSVSDILSRPLTTPPTTVEQRVASNVVRRMMSTSQGGERIRLPIAGQVRHKIYVNNIVITQYNVCSLLHLPMCQQPGYLQP